ncbi:MAG TPA: hypothetical protein VFS41_12635 [Edaphobacter sp.]|nr:hypothetical protein [Edaphobacter sp.]
MLLNFLWFSVSLTLVLTWVRAVRLGDAKQSWTTFIALILLLVLLLPVISMTDDLVAMESRTELEHVVRRSEMPLLQVASGTATAFLDLGVLAVLLLIGFAVLFSRLSRFSLRVAVRKIMAGFVRTAGVRPPPAFVFVA